MQAPREHPEWFDLGNPLLWHIPQSVYAYVNSSWQGSANRGSAVRCAVIHFIHCLGLSVETNRKGQHAVAICLLRQCVDALVVIEIGLLQDSSLSEALLDAWIDGSKTAGAIRKELESKAWPRYGQGLWGETWAHFIGEFAQALHPYAHYSSELQSWQFALTEDKAHRDSEGNYLLLARVGLDTYEANKATRVTLLHILLSYILGRIAVENGRVSRSDQDSIMALGKAIAESEELWHGKVGWHEQFWAHEFVNPDKHEQPTNGDGFSS